MAGSFRVEIINDTNSLLGSAKIITSGVRQNECKSYEYLYSVCIGNIAPLVRPLLCIRRNKSKAMLIGPGSCGFMRQRLKN